MKRIAATIAATIVATTTGCGATYERRATVPCEGAKRGDTSLAKELPKGLVAPDTDLLTVERIDKLIQAIGIQPGSPSDVAAVYRTTSAAAGFTVLSSDSEGFEYDLLLSGKGALVKLRSSVTKCDGVAVVILRYDPSGAP